MKTTILAIFALVLLASCGQTAFGCSCVVSDKKQNINYKKWLKGFDGAAFTGRVKRIETDSERFDSKVTFAVRTYWTGVDGAEVVIHTPSDSGLCGIGYEEGKDYTVIADRSGGKLSTYLCSELVYSENRNGYLEALGDPKRPSVTGGPDPQKFDEFGDIGCEDELARLDLFANELQNDPASAGFIIIYGGQKGKRNEAKARLARMAYYLSGSRGLDPGSFIAVDGGFRDRFGGELFIARPGDANPEPVPSVEKNDVRFKGKAKVRGYNCGDEMGT